ncbi:MAG: hypothetical protein WDO24_15420 [Pseudomonadota bacterium]
MLPSRLETKAISLRSLAATESVSSVASRSGAITLTRMTSPHTASSTVAGE